MINKHTIKVQKSGRYFSIGELSSKVKTLWIVFHGYGQLADEFLENFNTIHDDETLIIAPEALNKFYFRGFSGKIGATWMTKEDRENEINDYINFINRIYKYLLNELNHNKLKLNLVGFSQGCHTAVRWLNTTKIIADNLILWSGSFPRDCDYKSDKDYWKAINKIMVLGDNDRFLDDTKISNELKILDEYDINIDLVNFNGGHNIDQDVLKKLAAHL